MAVELAVSVDSHRTQVSTVQVSNRPLYQGARGTGVFKRIAKFSNQEKILVGCSHDSCIRDLITGEQVLFSSERCQSLAISDDDAFVAIGHTRNGNISVHSLRDGDSYARISTLKGHSSDVECLCFSQIIESEKKRLLSGSLDNSIRMWDYIKGNCLRIFKGHSHYVSSVHIHCDWVISTSYDTSLKIWSALTSECLASFKAGMLSLLHSDINNHKDPSLLAVASSDFIITVWQCDNLPNLSLKCSLRGHSRPINAVCFHPRWYLDWIASCSWDNTVRLWSIISEECIHIFDCCDPIHRYLNINGLSFNNDGDFLFIINDLTLLRCDTSNGPDSSLLEIIASHWTGYHLSIPIDILGLLKTFVI